MHIDITVAARLQFFGRQKELLVQFLVQLVEDQGTLGGNQCGVRVCILLIPDIHNRLALLVHIIEHAHKVLLIVAVIAVAFCHDRLHIFQSAFHDIVHHGNRDLINVHLIDFVHHRLADPALFILGKIRQRTIGRFSDSVDDFLDIKLLAGIVFFDHFYRPIRLI